MNTNLSLQWEYLLYRFMEIVEVMEVNLEINIYPISRLEELVIERIFYHRVPMKFFGCTKSCPVLPAVQVRTSPDGNRPSSV